MAASYENRVRYLLDRCLSGKETTMEREELDAHFAEGNDDENLSEELLNTFYQSKDLVDMVPEKQNQILNAIRSLDDNIDPIIKIRYWRWTGVAAVFLAVLLSVIWLRKEERPSEKVNITAKKEIDSNQIGYESDRIVEDRAPAKDVAVLEMADGSRFELEKLGSEEAIEKEGIIMKRAKDGTLLLRFVSDFEKNRNFANHINTIKTPRGGTYKVILPDNTIVHLNSDSKLSFPTAFDAKERRVSFEGEGYFNVAKDTSKQFVVVSEAGKKNQEIRVYGTAFNLAAYPDDSAIKTTLVEGSVKVRELRTGSELILKPHELAVLNNDGLTMEIADLEANLAWKNNMFYFAGVPVETVFKHISRWYDVDIVYPREMQVEPLWGQISRKKKLSEVLEILEKTTQLKFKIKGKEVAVMD